MKIVHIVRDEKFIDAAYSMFERAFPGENEYLLFSSEISFKYLKKVKPKVYSDLLVYIPAIVRRLVKGDVVIFHAIDNTSLKILEAISGRCKTIWLGWGFDYYGFIDLDLYEKNTGHILNGQSSFFEKIKAGLFDVFGKGKYPKNVRELINRFDVFSPVIYEDYVMLARSFDAFKPEFLPWNYGTLEDDLIRGFESKNIDGNNFLLGNSSAPTNNHFEIIDKLSKLNLDAEKVIVPLSYGNSECRKLVVGYASQRLGDRFLPLLDFMPIDDYVTIIQSCSNVVMNHIRQQGLGNIVISLYLGAKVYLNPKSPLYDFFKKNGLFVFTTEEIEAEYRTFLSEEQIEFNRQFLRSVWSRDVMLKKTINLVNHVF